MKKVRVLLTTLFFLIVFPLSIYAAYPGECTITTSTCTTWGTVYCNSTCASHNYPRYELPPDVDENGTLTYHINGTVPLGDSPTPDPTCSVTHWWYENGQWTAASGLQPLNGWSFSPSSPSHGLPYAETVQDLPAGCPDDCDDEYTALEAKCASMPPQPGGQTVDTFDYETCEGTCTCPTGGTYAGELPVTCVGFFCTPDPLGPGDKGCTPEGCEVEEALGWPTTGPDWANEYNIIFDMDYTGESCSVDDAPVDPEPPEEGCDGWAEYCAHICASVGDTVYDDTCNDEERTCQCATFVAPGAPPGSPPVGFPSPPDYDDGTLKPIAPDPEVPEDPSPEPDPAPDPAPDPEDNPDDLAGGWLKAIKENTDKMIGQNNKISDNTHATAHNTGRTVDALNTANSSLNNIQSNTSATATKLNATNSTLSEISDKLDGLDNSGVESRLDTIHGDVNGVEGKLDEISGKLDAEHNPASLPSANSYNSDVTSPEEQDFTDTINDFIANAPFIGTMSESSIGLSGIEPCLSCTVFNTQAEVCFNEWEQFWDAMGIMLVGFSTLTAFFIIIGRG